MPELYDVNIAPWVEYSDIDRAWPTDRAVGIIKRIIEERCPNGGRILVVGCGGSNSEVFDYAKEFGETFNIVGIDVNEGMVVSAYQRAYELDILGRVSFENFSITDERIIGYLTLKGKFNVVTFIGVEGNIVHDKDLLYAYLVANELLEIGGYLVVSDYMMLLDDVGWWYERYRKCFFALLREGFIDTEGIRIDRDSPSQNEMWGTIIIRPYGLSAVDAMRLNIKQLRRCLRRGEFERLARHRQVPPLHLLELAGFEVNPDLREMGLVEFVGEERIDMQPWERLPNYRYGVKKTSEGWDIPFNSGMLQVPEIKGLLDD